jgi:hypothetical protein
MSITEKLGNLTVAHVCILLLLATAFPLINPLLLPFPVDANVQAAFDVFDQLPEGSVILWHTDTSLAQMGDVGVGTIAIQKAIFSRPQQIKLIMYSSSVEGADAFALALTESRPENFGKAYGVDYAILPYKAGGLEVVHAAVASGIQEAYPEDYYGTPTDQIPIMEGVIDYSDVDIFMTQYGLTDSCDPGLRQWTYKYGIPTILNPMSSGLSYAAQYFPDVVLGVLGGAVGGSQLELLTGLPGKGVKYNDAKNLTYLVTDVLIAMGTIIYWYRRLSGLETIHMMRDRDYGG